MFKLRSGKVRLADDKTLDIPGIEDVVLKTYFDQQWKVTKGSLVVARGNKRGSLYMVKFGEVEEAFLHNVSKDKETVEVGARVAKSLRAQVGAEIRVRGPITVGASRIVEDQMKKTLETKHPLRMEAPRVHMYEGPTKSPGLKAFLCGSLDLITYTQQQKRGFSASLAGRKPKVQIEENSVRTDSSTEVTVGDEREVEVLRSFNWPPSELIMEGGVLPERDSLDSLYLLILIIRMSQSRQHECLKSPTAVLFDVNTGRISIFTVNTKEYHSDVLSRSQG
ncbi:hypothetical protein Tco_1107174 [Tanacetum coccineum]